jgi:hypothetical protein
MQIPHSQNSQEWVCTDGDDIFIQGKDSECKRMVSNPTTLNSTYASIPC